MTVARFRKARESRWSQPDTSKTAADRGRATAESPLRQTQDDYADYIERVYPALTQRYALCQDVQVAIYQGTAGATPERILQALSSSGDAKIDAYTQAYRDQVVLACVNHGIDPATGEPDRQVQRRICDALRAGLSEHEALRLATLGAHALLPPVLLRDDEFREAVEASR